MPPAPDAIRRTRDAGPLQPRTAGSGLLVQAREKLAGAATLNLTVARGGSVARTLMTAHFEKLFRVRTG